MPDNRNPRQLAEAKFAAKQARIQEGKRAMSEYEAQTRRTDENTARLRALRLAREAEAADAGAPARRKPANRRKYPNR